MKMQKNPLKTSPTYLYCPDHHPPEKMVVIEFNYNGVLLVQRFRCPKCKKLVEERISSGEMQRIFGTINSVQGFFAHPKDDSIV